MLPSCYLCGQSTTRLIVANPQHSYLSCWSCGFRMVHPLPSDPHDDRLYDDAFYSARGLEVGLDNQTHLTRDLIQGRVQTLTALNGGPGSLLDVGAGTGLFVEASVRAGWRGLGVEMSPAAVRIANKISRAPVIQGRVEELSFDGSFDAITFWDVLEHLPDPRAMLITVRHLLRDDGIVCVSLPNVAGMKARALGNHWRYYRYEFGHVSHFSPGTLTTILGQAGYVPQRVATSGAFNLGKPFGLDAVAVRERHRALTTLQNVVDGIAGRMRLGENMVAFARSK